MVGLIRRHVVDTFTVSDPEPVIASRLWDQQSSDDKRQSAIDAARRTQLCIAGPGAGMRIECPSSQCRCVVPISFRGSEAIVESGVHAATPSVIGGSGGEDRFELER